MKYCSWTVNDFMSEVTHWNLGGMASGNSSSIRAWNSMSLILFIVFTAHTWNRKHVYIAVLLRGYVIVVKKKKKDLQMTKTLVSFLVLPVSEEVWLLFLPNPPIQTPKVFKRKQKRGFLSAFTLQHKQFQVWGGWSVGVTVTHCSLTVSLLLSTKRSPISSAVRLDGIWFSFWSLRNSIIIAI